MSKKAFYISAEVQNNLAVVKIEGYISSWDRVAANFKAQVDALVNAGIKDFTVYINSEGGSVFEANEIVNELKRFKGTSTAMLGALCASAATSIAISCNKVIASANTQYMIHKPSTYVSGNSAEIEAQLKALKNIESYYLKAYVKKTGLSELAIEALWQEDYWMDAEEARDKHFVDEIDQSTEASISADDILAIKAVGYKNTPEFKATTTTTTQTQTPDIMKDKLVLILAAMPGLTITAANSENELLGFVEAIKAKAILADSLQAKLDALTKEADKAKRDAILNNAEAKKKFTPAQRGYYEAMLVKDFDATKAHIEAMPEVTQLSTTTATNTGAADSRANWTYADYQEKDPTALAELAETDNEAFEKLFKAHYAQK